VDQAIDAVVDRDLNRLPRFQTVREALVVEGLLPQEQSAVGELGRRSFDSR
jgi:hypothetical protein